MQPTTAKDLLEFWPNLSRQGLIAKAAAANYKNAVNAILSGTETPNEADVKELDVDELFRRFVNLNAKRYKPETLGVIESRFRRARSEFLRWAENPKAFQPEIGQTRRKNPSTSSTKSERRKETKGAPDDRHEEEFGDEGGPMISYPLPLRPGIVAKLTVPADLTDADVSRITAFLKMAVLPPAPKGGPS